MENVKQSEIFNQTHFQKWFLRFRKKGALRSRFAFAQPLKNERGFVLVMSLAMIPILITALLCILSTMWFVRQKERMQLTCEKHILIAQQILIDGAYDLIELNPKVDELVDRKEQLEWEMKMAQGPERMSIAAQLIIVRARMIFLRFKQKVMIKKVEAKAYAELAKITAAAQKQAQEITRAWKKGSLMSRVKFGRPKMEVDPHYEDFSLPTYDFGTGYQNRQTLQVDIRVEGASPLPSWATRLLRRPRWKWQEKCSSQPKQEGGATWRSYLSAVKPS